MRLKMEGKPCTDSIHYHFVYEYVGTLITASFLQNIIVLIIVYFRGNVRINECHRMDVFAMFRDGHIFWGLLSHIFSRRPDRRPLIGQQR